MKRIFGILAFLVLMLVFAYNLALAAATASRTVTISVSTITEFTTSGNPAALVINMAEAGSQPTSVTNSATVYNISTNESNKKITGVLNSSMPADTSLKIRLAAPTGASSMGDVNLSTTAADLVTGISKIAESGKTITYTFSSTVAAGIVATGSRTVTLTVTN